MNEQEKYVQMLAQIVTELLNGIDAGDFADASNIPDKYKYRHLMALFSLAYGLDNGVVLYEQLYDLAMKCGKMAVKEKIQKGEKVKIAFLAISAAEWPAEEVYRLLEKDARCECYIVVCPLVERSKEAMKQTYIQTYQYLEQSGHEVRKAYHEETDTYLGWESLGGIPDIVIHLTKWYRALPEDYWIESLPLRCLNCYIPYGMSVMDSKDGAYTKKTSYNAPFTNMLWKSYVTSEANMLGYHAYELLHGKNVFFSGYAKMDYFYDKRTYAEEEIRKIWKSPVEADIMNIKKIIIAPHYSVKNRESFINLSTFPKNMYFWNYLAKKYRNEVSFILKPHPNLRARAVEAGLFESFAAYDAYLEEWNSMPNAKVVEEADYRDIFATSDGMMMDSGSFLAEYMYVDKPLLFLRKKEQAFNNLGEKLLNCCYQVQGEDYMGIEDFLNQTILQGKDELGDIRKRIFEEELNYVKKNQCKASEIIYQDILGLFY